MYLTLLSLHTITVLPLYYCILCGQSIQYFEHSTQYYIRSTTTHNIINKLLYKEGVVMHG